MINVGSPYTTSLPVVNAQGNAVDAATVTLVVTKPDQTADTFTLAGGTVIRDALGQYHVSYTPTLEGLYKFTWTTTGPVVVQADYASAVAYRAVASIDEVRTYIGETDTSRDDILRQVIMALTEKIESVVGTCVIKTFTNEHIVGYNREVIRLPHAPLPTETSVSQIISVYPGGPSWGQGDLIVHPDSGTVEPLNMIPFWWGPWKATYTAGRAVIPQPIQLALKEAVFEFWATQRPYGSDQLAPGMDDTSRWETALASYDLPPHAKSLIEDYELPGFA